MPYGYSRDEVRKSCLATTKQLGIFLPVQVNVFNFQCVSIPTLPPCAYWKCLRGWGGSPSWNRASHRAPSNGSAVTLATHIKEADRQKGVDQTERWMGRRFKAHRRVEVSAGGGDRLRKRKMWPLGKMNWSSLHRAEVDVLLAHGTVPQTEQTLRGKRDSDSLTPANIYKE